MRPLKPVTIIGGGLAGLTLGIGLRRRGIPTVVFEAGTYPRHRVCGEFISGRGQEVLADLGLREALVQAGAIPAGTALFFFGSTSSPSRPITPPALCLSRFTMDALLAERFRNCGGDLREHERGPVGESDEGLVFANGRRKQTTEAGCHWFGLKVHARDLELAADLEMHVSPPGYVGLTRLKDGAVNVCGLFRRRHNQEAATTGWQRILRGAPGTALDQRLAGAKFDAGSFCSVAALSLRPARAADTRGCCIGDALTMIPPVTGNGMSMAFEAADLAIDPLARWSRGEASWPQTRQAIATACDRAFARRLKVAQWLQWLLFSAWTQGVAGRFLLGSAWLWRFMFSNTR